LLGRTSKGTGKNGKQKGRALFLGQGGFGTPFELRLKGLRTRDLNVRGGRLKWGEEEAL